MNIIRKSFFFLSASKCLVQIIAHQSKTRECEIAESMVWLRDDELVSSNDKKVLQFSKKHIPPYGPC